MAKQRATAFPVSAALDLPTGICFAETATRNNPAYTAEVQVVTVSVLVRDHKGRLRTDLGKQDFALEGIEQRCTQHGLPKPRAFVTDFAKSNCRSGRFQPLSSSPAPTHT